MLGRFIGAAFIIPGLYFASRGYMTKKVAWQTLGISSMLGFQVGVAWKQTKWKKENMSSSLINDLCIARDLWDGIW